MGVSSEEFILMRRKIVRESFRVNNLFLYDERFFFLWEFFARIVVQWPRLSVEVRRCCQRSYCRSRVLDFIRRSSSESARIRLDLQVRTAASHFVSFLFFFCV